MQIFAFCLAFAALGMGGVEASVHAETARRNTASKKVTMGAKPCHFTGTHPNPPGTGPELRATPTYWCTYGAEGARQRFSAFFDTSKGLEAEEVATALGLPKLPSAFDDPRIASYSAIVTGAGGWRYFLSVDERSYPLHSGPPRFIHGLIPKRLGGQGKSRKELEISFTIPRVENRSERECNIIYSYYDAAGMSGWTYDSHPSFASEGHQADPVMIGPNGRTFSVSLASPKYCQATLLFGEGPKPDPWQ